jgi:tetratricopeptide (TPR) repeat protein
MTLVLLTAVLAAAPAADKALEPFAAPAQSFSANINGDAAVQADAFIDWNAVLDRAFSGLSIPADFVEGFRKGYNKTSNSLARALVDTVKKGGGFRLLRLRKSATGKPLALYRVTPDSGGVNYLELELERRANGTVRAVEVEPYLSGEPLSVTARRLAIRAAAEAKMNFIDKLAGKEGEFIKHAPKFKQMTEHLQAGRFADVLAVYDTLPQSLKEEKTALLQRLTAAQSLDDEKYQSAMADFEKWHPKDPSLDLVTIDHSFMAKKWDKVHNAIGRLDKRVEGDPYLAVISASTYMQEDRFGDAKKVLDASLAAEPTLAAAWWARVEVAMKTADHADTAKQLDGVIKALNIKLDGVANSPEYAAFRASKPGKAWLKANKY